MTMYQYRSQVNKLVSKLNYNIVDELAILGGDKNWHSLYQQLQQSRRDHYRPHEKYIVHHQDTEYFLHGTGFVAENFSRMLRHLDIDPCRFIIFVNQFQSRERWLSYCDPGNQYEVIESPFTEFLKCDANTLDIAVNNNCMHYFSCLMGQARCHRDKIAYFLKAHDLVNKNIVLYHRYFSETCATHVLDSNSVEAPFEVVTVTPWTRINENWSNFSKWKSSTDAIFETDIPEYRQNDKFNSPWYKSVFVDLVAESVFDYPHAFISEKTIRPIVNKKPFVVVGAPNTLKWLQSMGFKTFDQWWDESYDQINDPDSRLEKIFSVINMISSCSLQDCDNMLAEMTAVLDHNQQVYQKLWQILT